MTTFTFDFTEWSDTIAEMGHSQEIKDNWFLCNSSHVVDLAFFLGGYPIELSSYIGGENILNWHKRCSIYAGAGRTEQGSFFSYHANWGSPGRWGIEILTVKHRLIFRPMEKLQIQNLNSVRIDSVEIDDMYDVDFKPGLYQQVQAFLAGGMDRRLLPIEIHLRNLSIYEKMEKTGRMK